MAESDKIIVDLDFNANTRVAKQKIEILQGQLTNLMVTANKEISMGNITKELEEASKAAASLKAHLDQAVNTHTGKLDLGLLNKSFKDAGVSLSDYRIKLSAMGKDGQRAFANLAQSILQADVPLKQTSALMSKMATTLKNTARWQISSSVLHSFMGSIQTAFYYAKDLNESLNNIRIVTGQSTDEMARFASEANKAAQTLSTTTTKYTDAALIYYQQGLSDEEVKKRTDVTIKMANVSRQSAEEVSSQMTAVWNNFNKDLDYSEEHFADVMTKLGAETASSSKEIAEGLSKFSGIANTVGLSFDYAASALATITATSRESADVVGTSLKTIFARLQGLKLGETLDDGTELNQYSQALEKIGVNIFDTSGELKKMDEILDETGEKWKELAQDEKMATAQTVAGVRQYQQFMTLMNNWDFMKQNIQRSKDSEGTLQKQADIYAESWEAARDRVSAAAEEIYSKLLNDKFFTEANDDLANFLGLVSNTIDAMGGLKGVVNALGLVLMRVFKEDLANSIDRFIYNLQDKTKLAQQMRQEAVNNLGQLYQAQGYSKDLSVIMAEPQQALIENAERLTEVEKQTVQALLEQNAARVGNLHNMEEELTLAKQTAEELKSKVINTARGKENQDMAKAYIKMYEDTQKVYERTREIVNNPLIDKYILEEDAEGIELIIQELLTAQNDMAPLPTEILAIFKSLKEELNEGSISIDSFDEKIALLKGEIEATTTSTNFHAESYKILKEAIESTTLSESQQKAVLEKLSQSIFGTTEQTENFQTALEAAKKAAGDLTQGINTFSGKSATFGQNITNLAQGVGSLSMGLNSLKGVFSTLGDSSLSFGEKALSSMTSLGMTIPMVISGFRALQAAAAGLSIGLGPLLAIITGISVAITAISSLFDWVDRISAASQAEEAAKAAKGLAEQYDAVKQSYEDLKSSLEDYNTAKDALNDMTIGTQEWRDAVTEVNDKVLELIANYPSLAAEVKNVNGILELSQKGQNDLINLQNQQIEDAKNDLLAGQINKNEKREKAYISDNAELNMDKLINAYALHGNAIFSNTEILKNLANITEDTAKEIIKNRTSYEKSISEIIADRKQSEVNSQELISGLIENQKETFGKQGENFSNFASSIYQSILAQKEKEYADITSGSLDDDEIQEWYRAKMGYESVENLSDDQGEYRKADGTTVTIDDSVARSAKAAEEALNQFKDSLDDLSEKFKFLQNTLIESLNIPESTANNLILALQGALDFSELTTEELNQLKEIGENGLEGIVSTEEDREKFYKALGLEATAEGAEELRKRIEVLKEDITKIDFSSIVNNTVDSIKTAFDKVPKEELSAKGAQTVKQVMEGAFADQGPALLNKVTTLFQKAGADGKLKELNDTLGDISWDSISVEEFKNDMEDLGIDTNLTDQDVQNLINSMQDAEESIQDLAEATAAQYGEIHKVIDDLKLGDIISQEDFDKLKEVSKATDQYFTQLLDGTYKLTGDAQDFYDTVQGKLIDKVTNNINNLQAENDKIDKISGYDFNSLSQSQGYYNKFDTYYNDQGFSERKYTIDYDEVKKSLEVIELLSDNTREAKLELQEWKKELADDNLSDTSLKNIGERVKELSEQYPDLTEKVKQNNYEMNQQFLAIAMTAKSMEELDELFEKEKISDKAYDEALGNLHKEERMEDLDPEEVEQYAKYLQELAASEKKATIGSEKLSKDLKNNDEAAEHIAIQVQRMNKAVKALNENWKEWSSVLKKSTKGSEEHFKAVQEVKDVMSDLTDISADYIDTNFVDSLAEDTESMKLMEKAAKGDADAIDELRQKTLDNLILHLDLEGADIGNQELLDRVHNLQELLDKNPIEAGAKIDLSQMANDEQTLKKYLKEMIKDAGLSATEVNNILGGMGFHASFKKKPQYVTVQEPDQVTTHHRISGRQTVKIKGKTPAEDYEVEEWDETTTTETTPGKKKKIQVDAYAMATAPPGVTAVPEIKELTSTASGSANNFSSSNPGGKSGGGSKGGGGGRGSKGRRPSQMSQMKKAKGKPEKKDPYWEENQAIQQTERKINKYNEEAAYKFGREKVKLIEKQNALLKIQLKNYQALGKEQERQLKKLKEDAEDKLNKIKKGKYKGALNLKNSGLGLKVKYNEDDSIANYAGLMNQSNKRFKKEKKEFNNFVEDYEKFRKRYNKAIKDEDYDPKSKKGKKLERQREYYEKLRVIREKDWDNEQQLYKDRIAFIKDYTELVEQEIQDRIEKERELIREQIENNILKWDTEVQFDIDTREAERSWKKFIKKMEKGLKSTMSHFHMDEAADNITTNANEITGLTKDYQEKTKQYQTYEWIANNWDEYTKLVPEGERLASSASEAAEKAREYKKELEDIGERVMSELQEGWNTYLDSLNEGKEALDFMNDKLKEQGDIIDYNKQMIEMIYGDKAYDKMEKYYKTQDIYLQTQIAAAEHQQKIWNDEFEAAAEIQAANNEAFDINNVTTWSDAMITAYQNAQEASANLRDAQLGYVQNQIDMYNNTVDEQMDAFERSLTGGNTLEEEMEKWERAKKEADLYLDDTERTYQIQTLMNKFDKSINETKEVNAVKQLTKAREEELKQLIKKGKLTQFDLDVANARYELELKKIALEEAQNNKNTMKLTRNAEGNWSYQYVVNQEDVDAKAQEVLDAENNWYKISKENQRRTKDEMLNIWSEAISKMSEVLKDQNLTMEERQARANEIAEWAGRMSEGLADENYVSIQNMLASTATLLSTAYETDSQSFEQYNKDKVNFLDQLKTAGIQDFIDLFDAFGLYAEKGAERVVTALVNGDTAAMPTIVTESWKFLMGKDNSLSKAFGDAGDFIIKNFVSNPDSVMNKLIGPDGALPNIDLAGKECWSNIGSYADAIIPNLGKVTENIINIGTQMETVESSVTSNLESIRLKLVNELIPAWKAYWEAVNQSADDSKTKEGAPPPLKVTNTENNNGGGSLALGMITTAVTASNTVSSMREAQLHPFFRYDPKTAYENVDNKTGKTQQTGTVKVIGTYVIETAKNGKYKVTDLISGDKKGTFDSLKEAKEKANNLWDKDKKEINDNEIINSRANDAKKYVKDATGLMFDTGGYTGDWDGNDGRLAILHQKELVLNAKDTENMLDAVDTIRNITGLNSSITDSIAKSISGLIAGTAQHMLNGGNITQDVGKNEHYTIENITAEFPNAESVDEIREAIMSLPRLASQYVARNLK